MFLWAAPAAVASDTILAHVPSDCALVVVAKDFETSVSNLNDFIQAAFKGRVPALDTDGLMRSRFALSPEWRAAKTPILIAIRSPGRGSRHVVVGFTRRSSTSFQQLDRATASAEQIVELEPSKGGSGYAMRAGNFVFLSPSRSALTALAAVEPGDSLSQRMNADQRALYDASDVYVHAAAGPWTPVVRSIVQQARVFVQAFQMMGAVVPANQDATAQMMEWAIQGALRVFDEMEWTDLAVRLDPVGFRLTHLHQFIAGGAVAEYFASAQRSGDDVWAGLPDGPMLMAFGSVRHCRSDVVLRSLTEKLCAAPSVTRSISAESRKELVDSMDRWAAMLTSENFVLCPAGKRGGLPLALFGTNGVASAEDGIKLVLRLQQLNAEVASTLLMMGTIGDIRTTTVHDTPVYEIRLQLDAAPQVSDAIALMYGREARTQFAALGPRRIGYAMTNRADGIGDLLDAGRKSSLGRNPAVTRLMGRIQAQPGMVLIADMGRVIRLGLEFARKMGAGSEIPDLPDALFAECLADGHGPLAAWSLRESGRTLRGEVFVSRDDARRIIALMGGIGERKRQATPRTASEVTPRTVGDDD